jgi:hypothetical protein
MLGFKFPVTDQLIFDRVKKRLYYGVIGSAIMTLLGN